MWPLAWGLFAFALSIVAQLVIWRIRRPAGQYAALSVLCLATLILSLGSFHALRSLTPGPARFLPATGLDYVNFAMLYVALVLAYMTTYSAVQADSPTMVILLKIEESGLRGPTLAEIAEELSDSLLIAPRLEDLVTGHLVTLRRGRYVIGPRGAVMAKTHILFRALLKMEKGG